MLDRAKHTAEVLELARILGFVMCGHPHDVKAGILGIYHACHAELQVLAYWIFRNPVAKARMRILEERQIKGKVLLNFEDEVLPLGIYTSQPYKEGGICEECPAYCNEVAQQLNMAIQMSFISESGVQLAMIWERDGMRDFNHAVTVSSIEPAPRMNTS